MSGATVVRQRGKFYELSLSTPSMSFPLDPAHDDGGPTYEQRYHADAARRFKAVLAPLDGPLDALLPGLAAEHPGVALLPLDDTLPTVHGRAEHSLREHRTRGRQACRCEMVLGSPPDSEAPLLEHASLALGLATLPEDSVLEGFFAAVAQHIHRLRVEHQHRLAELGRHSPPRQGAFHYRCSAGGIQDLNGAAAGRPLPSEAPPPRAGLELAATLAAIVAAAEADGVVHAELALACVRVTSGAVAIQGFGVAGITATGRAPEGRPDFFVGVADPPDWRLRQRWGLGDLCQGLLVGHEAGAALASRLAAPAPQHRPSPDEVRRRFTELAREASGPGLAQWLGWGAAQALDLVQRAPSQIQARLALGTRGILEPCLVCGRPTLVGTSRDLPAPGRRHRPDCCWRARDRRRFWLVGAGLLLLIAGGIWYAASR